MNSGKPWTRARLMKCILSDLAAFGFEKFNDDTLCLRNNEVVLYVIVDIARCHRDAGDTERTVYLNFWADLVESPLDSDPHGVRGLWNCMIDEYQVFNRTGPYRPYTLSAHESYDTSRLRKDLLSFGLQLLMAYATKQGTLNMLLGATIQLGGEAIRPFYPTRYFSYAIALYLADKLNNNDIADRAIMYLMDYANESEKHTKDLYRIIRTKKDIANVLNRRDKALYDRIISGAPELRALYDHIAGASEP